MGSNGNQSALVSQKDLVLLLIEDDPGSRLLLSRLLQKEGYTIIEAASGEEGLELFHQVLPNLVLLDAMLPGINGFETCRRILHSNTTPVLMVTSLEDTNSVNLAFDAGATDYVTKPVHWPVLRQRVRHILARQHLERMRDDLTNMIVHDMKAPLVAINGYMELLLDKTWGEVNSQQFRALERSHQNTQRLLNLTTMILDLARLEEGKLTLQLSRVYLPEMLKKATESLEWMAQNYGVRLVLEIDPCAKNAMLDEGLMHRVLVNLLSNAIKHSSRGGIVTVSAKTGSRGEVQIAVKDQGEGISEEDQHWIFDKYRQAAHRQKGSQIDSGLGLTFCKLAVEAQGGQIELKSKAGLGSTFTLIFPIPD